MWRVHGLLGRVLHRSGHGPLRLAPSHQDEVKNTSSLLNSSRHSSDTSSQRDQDEERRRKQRSSHFTFSELPRYSALDAVGWGAAAVLFMQICRRIHSQFSSGPDPRPAPGALTERPRPHHCGYRILLEILSRRDVLPQGPRVRCLQKVPAPQTEDLSLDQSSGSDQDSDQASLSSKDQAESPLHHHQRALLDYDLATQEDSLLSSSSSSFFADLSDVGETQTTHFTEEDFTRRSAQSIQDEGLEEAAENFRLVGDSSVAVILNIIGLSCADRENLEEAFVCFLAAAELGYAKAQFNCGVCYERGRGVSRSTDKALQLYSLAAAQGHAQAHYRCAKLLLSSRGQQLSAEQLSSARTHLEQASAAGVTKAQLCLASLCSWTQLLQGAAESTDEAALLSLGRRDERGPGLQQNLGPAPGSDRGAAKARSVLEALAHRQHRETLRAQDVLRSIRSAPCFPRPVSSLDRRSSPSAPSWSTGSLLPHSWSTGSLCANPALSPLPLCPHSDRGHSCRWTLGVG